MSSFASVAHLQTKGFCRLQNGLLRHRESSFDPRAYAHLRRGFLNYSPCLARRTLQLPTGEVLGTPIFILLPPRHHNTSTPQPNPIPRLTPTSSFPPRIIRLNVISKRWVESPGDTEWVRGLIGGDLLYQLADNVPSHLAWNRGMSSRISC